MARFVTGTIAQLSGKLSLNGKALDQPALSTLTRYLNEPANGNDEPVFKQVGIIKKEGERGRPAIVWAVDTDQPVWLGFGDITGTGLETSETLPEMKTVAA